MRKPSFAGAALALLCWGGTASAKGMTVAQSKAMAVDLGDDVAVDGNLVTIPAQGKNNWDAFLGLSDDGTSVTASISMSAIPPDNRAAFPFRDLLSANVGQRHFFGFHGNASDEWLDLEAEYDPATLNKQGLRKVTAVFNLSATIDGLPAGTHALKFGLHDVYGDRDADIVVPPTIAPRGRRGPGRMVRRGKTLGRTGNAGARDRW